MRSKPEISPRQEYLLQENRRVESSPLLAERFPSLKSMTVDLAYYDTDRPERTSQIKYTFNLERAKSVFRLDCQNPDCVGGDFDLSDVLAEAVMERRTEVTGELSCQGWRNKNTIGSHPCGKVIRFNLTLGY